MRDNSKRIILLGVLMLNILGVLIVMRTVIASPEAVVTVNPKISVKAPGESFEINVTVSDVSDLYGWEFNITFDPAILNVENVTEGPFLKQAGSTWPLPTTIDNDAGFVFKGSALFPPPETGASGNGTLATITFNVTVEGESNLSFSESKLRTMDLDEGIPVPIEHTTIDGVFIYPLSRDVAVTDVTASSTSVTAGELVSINVTVMNKGSITETFDVAVWYDSTIIETKTATDLTPDASATINFSWDTTDVAGGEYTITAEATPLSGETETADNTHSEIVVTVTVPSPSPVIPIELLIGAVVAMVVTLTVIFFFMKKRGQKT